MILLSVVSISTPTPSDPIFWRGSIKEIQQFVAGGSQFFVDLSDKSFHVHYMRTGRAAGGSLTHVPLS